MKRYSDVDRDSGVVAYEYGDNFIRVEFHDGGIYLYTYASAGASHIEDMKKLADNGDGLNEYINDYVKKLYARKER